MTHKEFVLFSNSILVAVATLNIMLASVILWSRREQASLQGKKENVWFAVLSLLVGMWTMAMVNYRTAEKVEELELYVKLLYFIPILIPICFVKLVEWSFEVKAWWRHLTTCAQKAYQITKGTIYVWAILLAVAVLFSRSVVGDVIPQTNAEHIIIFGKLYILYASYFIFAFSFSLYLLAVLVRANANGRRAKVSTLLLRGATIAISIPLITNLLLPWFGVFLFNWVGNLATLIWVATLFYAFNKFRFLNLRVFSLEIFIFVIWAILAVRLYFTAVEGERVGLDFIIFVLAITVGILLLRSVHRELETKEQLQHLTHQLQQANERLRELDKQKTEFLSIASHQLRGPVAVVRGYASLLKEGSYGALPPAVAEVVDRIESSASTMAQMVDDFLNVTRIEQGRMQYDMRQFDLAKLVQEVCEEASQRAKEKGLNFSCGIKGQGAFPYYGDEVKIRQVIANLVDNAIKYTPSGWVSVSLEQIREGQPVYMISVSDSGIGIPAEELPTLFNKFHRASNARGASVSGTGLGLYVAKRLVEAHGGSITATSQGQGKGSTFTVKLPALSGATVGVQE